jgi:hypothetical protein
MSRLFRKDLGIEIKLFIIIQKLLARVYCMQEELLEV